MSRRLTDRIPQAKPLFERRMVQAWSAAFVIAAALLLVINFYVFVSLREQIVKREEAQLRQIVDVTGAAVDHFFTTARETLDSIRRHIKPDTPPLVAHELLQTAVEAAPFIRVLAVVDVNGKYLHSSRAFPAPEMNLKDSPVIAYFRNKGVAADSHFMTAPTRNTLDKQWQVIVGIPRRGADGAATEVLAAAMDTKIIYSELMSSNQADGGEMTLVDSGFNLLASSPWRDEAIGQSLTSTPAYRALLQQTGREASGIVTQPDTGVQQISASRRLKDGRLSIAATRPLAIVLHDWRALSSVVLAVSIAILALLALSAFLSMRDALQRQRQSDALRLSQQRFRLLVDGATDHAIYMLDTDGKVSNWNHGAERIKGYSAEEITGKSFEIFYTPADRTALLPAKALAAAMTGVYRSEGQRLRKDGSTFWANIVLAAVFDADGKHIGFSKITRDITESNAIRQQLKLAKETAESAGAAKSAFLANMSHEIRTPLNGIIGYADLALEDRALSPDTRRHIIRVFEASKSLHVIIDDILDFSKIEARGVDLNPLAFHISLLADTCTSMIQPKAAEQDLDVYATIDADVPQVLFGDAPRLRQVLINLLNNAVKFTKSGSVTLAVKCLTRSAARARLQFSVSDTGIGISAQDQEGLFQRFSQADSSISRRFGGTGLGLAISKCIVDAMRGELTVQSEPGKGSTFAFEIDLPIADLASIAPTAAPAPTWINPLRILSVDDVEMNRALCKAILSRAGHLVTLAASGASAIELVQAQDFDVILMDIQMPEMDGLEVTRRIRALPDGRGTLPIVALTANVMGDQISLYKSAGMDGHIGKPIVKAELLASVAKWGAGTAVAEGPPMATHAPAAIHDQEALDELRSFVSNDIVNGMIGDLETTIAQVPSPNVLVQGDCKVLRDASHKAIALAGQLGLAELAQAFRTLEAACMRGQPDAESLAGFHLTAERARPSIMAIAAT
ncbi:MAG: ATP-binding protein [Pseudolabrys sp.]|nr:ATP-binding protein [Pseudolabrys sp.]